MTLSKKQKGDLLKSDDWNALTAEVERLGTEKLDRNQDDTFKGSLTVKGALNIQPKEEAQKAELSITGSLSVSQSLIVGEFLSIDSEQKSLTFGGVEISGFANEGSLKEDNKSVPTQSIIKEYVDNIARSKAQKEGSDFQDFAAKELTVKGTITANSFEGVGAFVVGMIIMWSGNEDEIPQGWALCNGSSDTPDLRGKFIVGASDCNSDYSPGKTGGEEKVTLTTAQMPRHNHYSGDYKYLLKMDGNATAEKTDYTANEPNLYSAQAIQEVGESQAHENRPPYYALCFIMYTRETKK